MTIATACTRRWRSRRCRHSHRSRPARDVGETIINRCTHGESLSGFSQQDYRKALQELPTEVEEYTDCANLIRHAQLAAGAGKGLARAASAGTAAIPATPAERATLRARPAGSPPLQVGGQIDPPGRRARQHRLGPELAAQPAAGDPGLPARVRAGCSRAEPSETVSAPTAPAERPPLAGRPPAAAGSAPADSARSRSHGRRSWPLPGRPVRCGGRRC